MGADKRKSARVAITHSRSGKRAACIENNCSRHSRSYRIRVPRVRRSWARDWSDCRKVGKGPLAGRLPAHPPSRAASDRDDLLYGSRVGAERPPRTASRRLDHLSRNHERGEIGRRRISPDCAQPWRCGKNRLRSARGANQSRAVYSRTIPRILRSVAKSARPHRKEGIAARAIVDLVRPGGPIRRQDFERRFADWFARRPRGGGNCDRV